MTFRKVAHDGIIIKANAQISAESLMSYMRIEKETEEFKELLQKRRENNFFNSEELAMDFKHSDIDTSDLLIGNGQLEKIDRKNCGIWEDIIPDCYRNRSTRDPERPLNRKESVNYNSNELSNVNSIVFETDKIHISEVKDEHEKLIVELSENKKLILFVGLNNIEMQNRNYHPPRTKSMDSIVDAVSEFDKLIVRNRSDKIIKQIKSTRPSWDNRKLTNTEITLKYESDVKDYVPKEMENRPYSNDDTLKEDISDLKNLSSVPSRSTERILVKTLSRDYNSNKQRLRILDILKSSIESGKGRTVVPYSKLSKPIYLEQVARLLQKTLVNIPQMELLLFTDEKPPEWLRKLNKKFPNKNNLDNKEVRQVKDYISVPDFVKLEYEYRKALKSREILLDLYQNGHIQREDIISYYIVPWNIRPSEKYVEKAINHGEYLRSKMKKVDNKYETNLYKDATKRAENRIYIYDTDD